MKKLTQKTTTAPGRDGTLNTEEKDCLLIAAKKIMKHCLQPFINESEYFKVCKILDDFLSPAYHAKEQAARESELRQARELADSAARARTKESMERQAEASRQAELWNSLSEGERQSIKNRMAGIERGL